MQALLNALNFFSQHINILGWGWVIYFIWKTSWKISHFFDKIQSSTEQAAVMQNTIQTMATNHLPHLQEGIDEINANLTELKTVVVVELKGIRNDLFQVALRTGKD